jgi:hypothetical protein
MTSHYTQGSVTALHDFGGALDNFQTYSFRLSQFHGHGSWLVCEAALVYLLTYYSCASIPKL